jgi:TPR repeat protein
VHYSRQNDHVKAVAFFRLAAEQGNRVGQCPLGCCYAEGDGVLKDLVKAAEWHQLAADQGDLNSQKALAQQFLSGWGVQKSVALAREYYQKAVDQAWPSPRSLLRSTKLFGP